MSEFKKDNGNDNGFKKDIKDMWDKKDMTVVKQKYLQPAYDVTKKGLEKTWDFIKEKTPIVIAATKDAIDKGKEAFDKGKESIEKMRKDKAQKAQAGQTGQTGQASQTIKTEQVVKPKQGVKTEQGVKAEQKTEQMNKPPASPTEIKTETVQKPDNAPDKNNPGKP